MLQAFGFFLPWIVFPYILAVIMPSWRWLLGCTLLIGGLIAYVWIDNTLAMQRPGYKGGPGDALGIVMFGAVTAGFASGVLVRAVSLVASASGRPKTAFGICVLGIAVPFLLLAAPTAWDAWQKRPAPATCIAAGFRIEIGGTPLDVPVARLFTIYRGPSSRADAYYLENVRSLRDLCGQTDNGARRVSATNFGIRFERLNWGPGPENICKPPIPAWAGALCAAAPPVGKGRIDQTDFPINAYVFSPDEVKLGEFLGSVSSYRDSLAAPRPGENKTFVTAEARTPDGNPLTFACRPQSDGSSWCTASYLWVKGAHLHYVFRSPPESIAERGTRVDAALRDFLAQLRAAN
jgi:hypothetical protein